MQDKSPQTVASTLHQGLALFALLGLLLAGAASATSVAVTNGNDSGAGSFRAAVAAANGDPTVDTIELDSSLAVSVTTPVVYTGGQDLTILGNDSSISGSGGANATTWDGGLFVSMGGADVTLEDLTFSDSFNNGIGIFIPVETGGPVVTTLMNVTIERSRFHGLYVDNQYTDDYNTDDVPHPSCLDPWPWDGPASPEVVISDSTVADNGTVIDGIDFDGSFATGCPIDFDGIRVDDGGDGGIDGSIEGSTVDGNRSDGLEYDERGPGDVRSWAYDSQFNGNGNTGTADLDDGFDIDETGDGNLLADFVMVTVQGNYDEGLDLDEAGDGSARVTVVDSDSSYNHDENVKVDEEDDGSLFCDITGSNIDGSSDQQGIQLTEAGKGNLRATVVDTTAEGNDKDALQAEQELPGSGKLLVEGSDLTGNGDDSLDLDNVKATIIDSQIDD